MAKRKLYEDTEKWWARWQRGLRRDTVHLFRAWTKKEPWTWSQPAIVSFDQFFNVEAELDWGKYTK